MLTHLHSKYRRFDRLHILSKVENHFIVVNNEVVFHQAEPVTFTVHERTA